MNESHPSENEYAQHYKDQEAIRRHRQIFWQSRCCLHSQILRSGASARIDPDHKLMPGRRFPPPWSGKYRQLIFFPALDPLQTFSLGVEKRLCAIG